MKCIVSTETGVALIDFAARRAARLPDRDEGVVYGISWMPGGDELVLGHAVSRPPVDGREDLEWYARSETSFVSAGSWRSRRCLSHPHQILCLRDGRIACTNTGRNCLTLLDPRRPNSFEEWRLTDHRWDRVSSVDTSGDHLNSVFEREGELWVMAHRFDRGSCVAVLGVEDLEVRAVRPVPWGTGMHNIWIDEEGRGFGLDSCQSALIDLASGQEILGVNPEGFARGLAVTRDSLVVGLTPRGTRSDRDGGDARLVLVSRNDLRPRWECRLPGAGSIREIRVVDEPDLAHHGIPLVHHERLWREASPLEVEFATVDHDPRHAGRRVVSQAGFPGRSVGLIPSPAGPDREGWLRADDLGLVVLDEDPGPDIAFEYDLREHDGGHASIACGVGPEATVDADMTLLLVQRCGDLTMCSVWIRGTREEPWTRVDELPEVVATIQGHIRATRHPEGGWQVSVCGTEVVHPSLTEAAGAGRWGIRWSRSAVRAIRD